MKMEHGLACAFAIVQHGAVATEQIPLSRQLGGHKLQFAEHSLILRAGIG